MIQQEVRSEAQYVDHGYYATGYPPESAQDTPSRSQPLPPIAQEPSTRLGEQAENVDQLKIEPQSTVEAQNFSAPYMEWDATR